MKRALGWAAAVLAALGGVVLYAVEPRTATYWAHAFLLAPLGFLVLELAGRKLPYRAQWGIAVPLALMGPTAYLLWPGDQWWLYGALAAVPLVLLAERREERLLERRGAPPPVRPENGDGYWDMP